MRDETKKKLNLILERYRVEGPMTVRRCYYVLLGESLVKDGLMGYQYVSRLLANARRDGSVPWEVIVDNTRSVQQRSSWSSFGALYEAAKQQFRKNSMDEQDEYVEVWVEKDAAAGSIYKTTKALDVPLVVARGFSSVSFIKNAADRFDGNSDKQITVCYLSDFDPEGNYFPEQLKRTLKEDYGCTASVDVVKVALTESDIQDNNLKRIPLKVNAHHAAKHYVQDFVNKNGKMKVELDAISGAALAAKLKAALAEHLDLTLAEQSDAESVKEIEAWEREHLRGGE